jgi:hypothetical protein
VLTPWVSAAVKIQELTADSKAPVSKELKACMPPLKPTTAWETLVLEPNEWGAYNRAGPDDKPPRAGHYSISLLAQVRDSNGKVDTRVHSVKEKINLGQWNVFRVTPEGLKDLGHAL